MSEAAATPTQAQNSKLKPEGINQWIAVVNGILAILVAVLGIFGYNQNNAKAEATATAEDLQGELNSANETIGVLRSENNELQRNLSSANADIDRLRAENEALTEELEAAGAVPPGELSTSGPPPMAGPVRHSGEVTLAEDGDKIDLNAPSTDQRWVGNGNPGLDNASLAGGQLRLHAVDSLPLEDGEMADYETCSTRSGYGGESTTYYDPNSLRGDRCFRLQSGRFATIVVISADADRATFAITTWEAE